MKFKLYILILGLISNNLISINDKEKNYKKAIYIINNIPDGYNEEEIYAEYSQNLIQAKSLLEKAYDSGEKRAFYDLIFIKVILFMFDIEDEPNYQDIKNLKKANKKWPNCTYYIKALSLYYLPNGKVKKHKNCLKELVELNDRLTLIESGSYHLSPNLQPIPNLLEPDINLGYKYLSKALELSQNRFFEKKAILLNILSQEDENIKNNPNIHYLFTKTYLLIRNMMIKKEFIREKDSLFYDKVIEIKNELEKELVMGAL